MMRNSLVRYGRARILCCIATAVLATVVAPVHAESFLAFYGGVSDSGESDVRLVQPGGTDLTFHDVGWSERPLERPYYWGVRMGHWQRDGRGWGVALDLTHDKVYGDLDASVGVEGTRLGIPVDTVERLGDTFIDLSMSHGLNQLTFNGMYRWQVPGRAPMTRLRPYVGVGAGLVIPHVEVRTATTRNDAYQLAGWSIGGLAGLSWGLGRDVALFVEYRRTHMDLRADLSGGGRLETVIGTSHYDLGLSYRFP